MTPRPHYATLYRDCQAALLASQAHADEQVRLRLDTAEYAEAMGRQVAKLSLALRAVGLLALGLAVALVVILAR